jgi:serine/threonine protein kinase
MAAKLEAYPQFARLVDAGIVELNLDIKRKFVCFIQEWVEGPTLKKFLESLSRDETLRPSFLLAYVKQLCHALSALNAVELRHDDLHFGNVMISPPRPGDLEDVSHSRAHC